MSEQVPLMLSPPRHIAEGTVVGSDVLARRGKTLLYWCLKQSALRPRSDRGKRHELGLFTYTRDHYRTLEKSGRRSAFSVSGPRYGKCLTNCVLSLSIGGD